MNEPAACGTYAGYQRHTREKTEHCDACRQANRDYNRKYRANRPADAAIREAAKNEARSRALWRLAKRHPAEFQIYVAEEMSQ